MTIETILNSDMSVAYITDCATSPVNLWLVHSWNGLPSRRQWKCLIPEMVVNSSLSNVIYHSFGEYFAVEA
jgi:hypothetical protein